MQTSRTNKSISTYAGVKHFPGSLGMLNLPIIVMTVIRKYKGKYASTNNIFRCGYFMSYDDGKRPLP